MHTWPPWKRIISSQDHTLYASSCNGHQHIIVETASEQYIAHRGTFSVDSGIVVSFRASAYQPHTTLATGVQILKYIKFPQGDKI